MDGGPKVRALKTAASAGISNRITDFLSKAQENSKLTYGILAGIAVLTAALPLYANNYIVEVGSNALFYMVLCLGLNITIGYTGLFNLGNAAFFAFGAYTTGILSKMGIDFWLTLPATVVVAIVVAIIIGGPTLKLRSDYLAIVTLGFGEITRMIARNLQITGGPSGLVGIPRPEIFGFRLYSVPHFYWVFYVLVILGIIVSIRLHNSRFGRALKCIRDDEDVAEAMGINTLKYKLLSYIVGSIFAGIGGSFFAVKMASISPESFLFTQSTNVLMAIVLGGIGKIPGVIIGATLLVIFPEVFRELGSMRMLFFGVILVVLMIFRPQGIWPEKRA